MSCWVCAKVSNDTKNKKARERYANDPEHRAKILASVNRYREYNKDKIKEIKSNYAQTERAKEKNRIRNKRHYDNNQEQQKKRIRNLASTPSRQYTYLKRRAKISNIPFELTLQDVIDIRSSGACLYCNESLSPTAPNLDRLDSYKGYTKENCVPCCLRCNTIKRDLLHPEELILFWKIEKGEIDPVTPFKFSLYVSSNNSSLRKRWGRLVKYSAKKNILLTLTFDQYREIIGTPCNYCGTNNVGTGYGIDKKIPELGYTEDNSVSCCPPCNQIKGNVLTPEQMHRLISVVGFFRG